MIQGKASQVFITGNTVAKVFDRTQSKGYRGSGEQSYQREKECLKRLEGNIHFPEVINFDDENLTIHMSYCGEVFPYDGKPRPELLEQVWQISEALDKANIKLYGGTLQKNNILLHDGLIRLVDFEYALPEGSNLNIEEDFIRHIRRHWDQTVFENRLKILLVNGTLMTKKNRTKYPEELRKANSMVKNEWNNYQKSNVGNSAKWRIENLDLRQFAGKDKTLLDLGANHGEFAVELADDFKHITALEPFVQAPKLSENVTWVEKGFKDYIAETKDQFDVVFSFAMTIQVRDNDGLSEHDIARGHHDLVKQNGIMIYETQKIQNRPLNQAHVDKMLTAFRMKFGKEIKSGNARESGKRQYYIFKK